jgi:phosphoglycerate dehydrogenase-like enzyme
MKIVFAEPIGVNESVLAKTAEDFKNLGHDFIYYTDRKDDAKEIIRRASDAEILVVSNIAIKENVLAHCPYLKLINVAFTGTDHIDTDYCKKNGISVCNAAGYSTKAVAELTIGMTISLLRNIVKMDGQTRLPAGRNNYLGTEIFDKTVGIIGTGAIGSAVAMLFVAFGCKVLAYSRTEKIIDGVEFVDLDYLLSHSDIVSLHIPATKDTLNLLDAQKLLLMKPNAVLINTARGTVVDYTALAHMLKDGKIAGAAVDIYETEPPLPADHPLLDAPSTLLMPHIAYATTEAIMKRFDIVIDNIKSFIEGNLNNRIV